MTEGPDDAPKPFHLRVKRDASLTGSIDELDDVSGYVVIVSDGVLALSWSGTRGSVTEAVALMGQIFADKLMVA